MPSRSQLRAAIRDLPIWDEVSTAYAGVVTDDFKKCLADLMESGKAGKDAYRECAKRANLSAKLKSVWTR